MYKIFKRCLAILIVLALPIAVSSCGDEDNDEPNNSDYAEMIVGTWSDEGHDNWYDNRDGDAYGYEFKKNGVCYVHGSCYGSGRYQIFDDRLIISFYDESIGNSRANTYVITKLTKNVLVIQDDKYYDEEEYYRVK